jgi:hypothetical protein
MPDFIEIYSRSKKPDPNIPVIQKSESTNVLSKYRSYTYKITLSCLSGSQLNDPKLYAQPNLLKYIVLQSGGKGFDAINSPVHATSSQKESATSINFKADSPAEINAAENARRYIDRLNNNPLLIAGFNQKSAGRFDMFIENLSIDSIISFTEVTNTTLPTTINFEVIEPYSVNGFLEALAVSASAAGWATYAEAPFVLLFEWIGYPDGPGLPNAKSIPEKRFITMGFSSMEVEITPRGTVYKCSAFAWGDRAHGDASRLSNTMSVTGNTVGELLVDLFKNFNQQQTTDRIPNYENISDAVSHHDYFDIKFDTVDSNGLIKRDPSPSSAETGNVLADLTTPISKSKLFNDGSSAQISLLNPASQLYGQPNYPNFKGTASTYTLIPAGGLVSASDSGTTTYFGSFGNTDKKYQISFNSGISLRDAVAELILNSEYVRNKLADLYGGDGSNSIDSAGRVDYFVINVETQELPNRDEIRNLSTRKYIFRVQPFKILRSRIPGIGKLQQNLKDLKKISVRSYNYIYSGSNTEILNFRLQYNYLYYEALPRSMGANDQPSRRTSYQSDDSSDLKIDPAQQVAAGERNIANSISAGATAKTSYWTDSDRYGPNSAVPRQDDPYYALSSNLHRALIDPKASMVQAELEILGDPYFLVTGGIGNQFPTTGIDSSIDNTQAPHLYGDCIIDITFQNPQDIDTKTGFMYLNQENTSPFHGAYRVLQVHSTFREGAFKQKLDLIKIPGQDPTNKTQSLAQQSGTVEKPNFEDATAADTSKPVASNNGPPSKAVIPTIHKKK